MKRSRFQAEERLAAVERRGGKVQVSLEISLASVCFVRNTNDIGSFRKQLSVFGKFMDGG